MGFLASADVHECSATDLIAGYVGQTGLKTVEVLEKALGKVLFIDEAYRLAEGHFATEAINTLVDSLTKPQFIGKMIVVLAGYEDDMNKLLSVNPGLSSRFSEEVIFKNMDPKDCLKLLELNLQKARITISQNGNPLELANILDIFQALSDLPFWGNGRDVKELAKSVTRATILEDTSSSTGDLTVSTSRLTDHLNRFMKERGARCMPSGPKPIDRLPKLPVASNFDQVTAPPPSANTMVTAASIANETEAEPTAPDSPGHSSLPPESRDLGVSDTVWNQLQRDQAAQEVQARLDSTALLVEKERESATAKAETLAKELDTLAKQAQDQEANEQKRIHEEMRLKHLTALCAQQDAEDRVRKIREEAERKKKEEVRVQTKLRQMGVCEAGFRWIKQADGYRCAGGSHFVDNGALGV
jgi:hypothetical protein